MTRKLASVAVSGSLLAVLFSLVTIPAAAQQSQSVPEVILELKNDTSPPLREMPQIAPGSKRSQVLPLRVISKPGMHTSGRDPVVQEASGPEVGTTKGLNFNGISDRDGVAPPDTNSAVGSTQVVETVNLSYQVYNKTTGASVFGPAEITSIFSGFGGLCETGSLSDPIILYDQAASRWVLGIVAFNSSFTSFDECMAVSTTSDATGSWYRYSFSFGSNLNDYDKLAVWSDGYYASYNIFQNGAFFIGPEVCSYNRTAMLAGNPATAVCFQRGTSDASFLPANLDGSTQPATGEPDFYLELGNTTTSLNLFKFHVDFVNPTNSTFTGPTVITVPSYSLACGGGTCIPQKGTTQLLDSLGDRLMHRLSYRNFGTYESLLATHSVKAPKAPSGMRWYEIRSPNTTPVLYQRGTFGAGAISLWMGSIAQDKTGDIALGFSASSSKLYPSIAYTGRVPTDALGTMESPKIIISGTGAQTGGLSRWGDYSSMAIDPSDDCTFWYSQEYLKTTGSFNWDTRLASFKFPGC